MQTIQLSVKSGHHHREFCPVSVDFDVQEVAARALKLTDLSSGQIVPVQTHRKGDKTSVSWIVRDLRPGGDRIYALSTGESPVAGSGTGAETPAAAGTGVAAVESTSTGAGVAVAASKDGNALDINIDGSLFTSYRFGDVPARPFLYPLIGPFGLPVTRRLASPADTDMDHHHHRSVWVSHGEVNGVDNWSELEGHGRTVHKGFDVVESGPVFGRLVARADWVGCDGGKVLEEVKDIVVYNLPASGRLLDLKVYLTATEGNVMFGDTKEGGIISVRVLPSMQGDVGGRIENSYGGIGEGETWGKQAHWCDYSGPVGQDIAGISIFDSPESFRFPTYWHVRDYGLMTANPFGLSHFHRDPSRSGDHLLPAGETLCFSYRLYIHPGDAAQARVAERYNDFVCPPAVEVHG